jgi:hypothetical protein
VTPSREELLDAMAARAEIEHAEAEGERRRDLTWTALACLAWSALGIFCILWSAHTTSYTYGSIAFFTGLGVGNAGIIFTLLGAYRRGEKRGDW